jgi:hypothetical protein
MVTTRKLQLSKTTLRVLTRHQLGNVAGGILDTDDQTSVTGCHGPNGTTVSPSHLPPCHPPESPPPPLTGPPPPGSLLRDP